MGGLPGTPVPGIGPARLHSLVNVCHTPYRRPRGAVRIFVHRAGHVRVLRQQRSRRRRSRAVSECWTRSSGPVDAHCWPTDPEFPAILRHIPEPPPVLFVQGDLGAARAAGCSPSWGAETTPPTARRPVVESRGEAAAAGVVVVSGMARGLDAVAHAAALDAGGATIGVLGNGLGVIYPAANRLLYQRVAEGGLLLTEFPPGERPHVGSFPRRNRLISGLARVTVVVEAAEGSGALITAGAALEQGREVMAVPGPVTSPQSVGPNRLIRDGAATGPRGARSAGPFSRCRAAAPASSVSTASCGPAASAPPCRAGRDGKGGGGPAGARPGSAG